ncbi:MAG: hypothetical protein AB7I18_07950 [Candidatus Berkiella sp.]
MLNSASIEKVKDHIAAKFTTDLARQLLNVIKENVTTVRILNSYNQYNTSFGEEIVLRFVEKMSTQTLVDLFKTSLTREAILIKFYHLTSALIDEQKLREKIEDLTREEDLPNVDNMGIVQLRRQKDQINNRIETLQREFNLCRHYYSFLQIELGDKDKDGNTSTNSCFGNIVHSNYFLRLSAVKNEQESGRRAQLRSFQKQIEKCYQILSMKIMKYSSLRTLCSKMIYELETSNSRSYAYA